MVETGPEQQRAPRRSLPRRLADGEFVTEQRRRRPWFDHLARAGGRYRHTQGDLMAAGVTYFAFLGLFPVLLLAAGIVGLVPAGDQLRIGMQRIWKGHVEDPDFWRDNLQDLLALVTLGLAGLASLVLTGVVTQATSTVLRFLGLDGAVDYGVLTWVIALVLAVVSDVVVFLWLLRVVPANPLPLRRLLPGALFGAAGVEALKLIGGAYVSVISRSLTASVFGGAVGLLVWINLMVRLAFYTAAWTATLRRVDLLIPRPVD